VNRILYFAGGGRPAYDTQPVGIKTSDGEFVMASIGIRGKKFEEEKKGGSPIAGERMGEETMRVITNEWLGQKAYFG